LDIEGAFPNAVTDVLIHNMRKRRIPNIYVEYFALTLNLRGLEDQHRKTCLRFDGYVSKLKTVDNGIGQGDTPSMDLYNIYNADFLELKTMVKRKAMAGGYVDDVSQLA
ncbi:hypothetical protein BDN72DRAFT_739840, partial [Pluteus cervinus]